MTVKEFFKQLVNPSKIMVFIYRVVSGDLEISFIHFIQNEKYMPSFQSHLTYFQYENRAHFQLLQTQLKQKMNLLKLWIRIQQHSATDSQG